MVSPGVIGVVREGAAGEHLGQVDEGPEVGELLGDAGVEVLLDEILGGDEAPGGLGSEGPAQQLVARG